MKTANKYDAFMKAKKVIKSCITAEHIRAARRYYYLFYDMYKDDFLKQELDNAFVYGNKNL